MPRQLVTEVENNFVKGLITEASGLKFPENACTETFNCVFNLDGSVSRRLGIDLEEDFLETTINREECAISSFLWKNVSGDGNRTLFVLQVGGTLYFYDTSAESLSLGLLGSTVDMTTFQASGAPDIVTQECQFSLGNKYLIVTHPYCDPCYVQYDTDTETVSATRIVIRIRDVEGIDDGYDTELRPSLKLSTLDDAHHYNLKNQGWTNANLAVWDKGRPDMPSNSDVMYLMRNASNQFSLGVVPNQMQGNTPAPRGHYILELANQDRATASNLPSIPTVTTGFQRPRTSAFFAGRVFYSGLNASDTVGAIYFTQILERNDQYGACYQAGDPTSAFIHDLLPADGGVLRIKEAGTIFKLVSIAGALIVFANNGVWSIVGSQGLGFSATDFTVTKISSVGSISAASFVDVGGFPAWWNAEGIYILVSDNTGLSVKSLTLPSIKSFYDLIPQSSKLLARGYFDLVSGVIQWLYRSEDSETLTEAYTYDRILNFNVATGAFYPWTIPTDTVAVNSIVVVEGSHGLVEQNTLVDDSDNIIVDDDGNELITFDFAAAAGGKIPSFRFVVSRRSGTSFSMTIGGAVNTGYRDWFSHDAVGTDYTSYFISGYKLHGGALKAFQPNIVTLFCGTTEAMKCYFQAIWDYANTGSGTGRWSSKTLIEFSDTNYDVSMKKMKVRGMGRALQYKIASLPSQPFVILGWTALEGVNQLP